MDTRQGRSRPGDRRRRPLGAVRSDGRPALIAVDTNILLYAHRDAFTQHEAALVALRELAEGPVAWALPVFVIGEFLRVTTHPRVLDPPSSPQDAVDVISALMESPSIRVISPGERYWRLLRETMTAAGVRGNLVMDAQIASVCLEHGATTILTEDRDFRRFDGIAIRRLPTLGVRPPTT